MKKDNKGFTLIEMIVVIVIIAILAAIAVPAVMKYIDEARNTKLITHASSARTFLETELLKVEMKSSDGYYDPDGERNSTNFDNAVNNVKKEISDLVSIEACSFAEVSSDGKGTCIILSDNKKVENIKGYRIALGTDLYDPDLKYVIIPLDGMAEIAPEGAD